MNELQIEDARRAMLTRPKFKAGQSVFVVSPSKLNTAPKGRYTIVRALPDAGGPVQYRVKGEGEAFERVVYESQLDLDA
jgi:hypothetical protein